MTVESTEVNTTPAGYKFLALMNVVIWAIVGGYIIKVLCQGLKTSKFEIKPLLP